jgi:hypothetical protein
MAHAEYECATDLLCQFDESHRDKVKGPKVYIGMYDELEFTRHDVVAGGFTITATKTGKREPIYCHTVKEIAKSVPRKLTEAEQERWITKMTKRLEAQERRIERAQERAGRTKLVEVEHSAWDRCYDATWNLITTAPTTLAGLATLLAYGNETGGVSHLLYGDDECLIMQNWVITCAACVLAGLPQPEPCKIVAEMLQQEDDAAEAA